MKDKQNILDKFKNPTLWIALIAVMFTAGGFFSYLSVQLNNIDVIDQRLDKKIKVINELEDEVIELEKRIIILETKNEEQEN